MSIDKGEKIAQLAVAFKHDPLGYVRHFFPWGEKDLSLSTGPREWQEWALDTIGKHLRNPATRFTPLRIAVSSGHSCGKAHTLDTIIPTPCGDKVWGEIGIGDLVFDEFGEATQVVGITNYDNIPMYRVTFDDRSYCDVSGGHLWNVRGRSERRNNREGWRTLETSEILELGVKRPNGVKIARQWEVPIQGLAQFDEREIDLHPYLVGVWLGDGNTKPYPEIAEKIESLGYEIKLTNNDTAYRIVNQSHLFRGGVFDCGSHERYIPDDYKFNTIDNRFALFCGLMDTDGEVHKCGSIGYSTTSKRLADDVIWLARSLGCKAMLQPTTKEGWYPDENKERVKCRDCYRITINSPFNPFTIKHRRDRYKVSNSRFLKRWIDSIEYIGDKNAMCISVANDSGLYLANDFIVTHNSSCIAMISQWALSTCVGTKIRVTANTRDQLRDITFPEISKWFRLALNSDWWEVTNTQVASVDDAQRQEWWCHAVTWSENNTEAFAGLHNHGKRIVMIFDEASAVADEVWEVAEGAEKDENTEIIWIAFGNPTRATGRFRECFRKFKHRWVTRQIDARTVEGINKEQIERDIADYGEDSDYVKIRIKGQFPDTSTSQFISSKIVEEAIHREPESSLYDPLIMGVDIARQGDDSTVIVQRRGLDCKSIPIIKFQCDDTMETAGRIASLWHQYQHDAIFLDLGAMGYGVYDRLKMLGIPCVGIQFGGKADRELSEGGVRYRNKRSEMWGYMKDWLRFGSIPDDEKLREELTSIEAKNITVGGLDVVALEEKAELKKRIGRSPDIADSLAISFAYSVAKRNHTEEIQGIYKNKGNQHKIDYEPL